jgi:1-acyl-sn-glycerol-3-phosphate acyltransferase
MYYLSLLRSIAFSILFIMWVGIVCILFSPFLIFRCRALYWTGAIWSWGTMILLRLICGTKYRVIGRENLPKGPYIVASKHQSTFETVVFWQVFYIPTYVLKRELTKIPFFGLFLLRMRMIAIDRSSGIKALKKIVGEAEYHIKKNRHIIIYPEGTRTEVDKVTEEYHPGVLALYKHCNVPIVPVALNSGKFWPSKRWMKYPGTITIKILPPIDPGMDKKEFMTLLNQQIENESLKL